MKRWRDRDFFWYCFLALSGVFVAYLAYGAYEAKGDVGSLVGVFNVFPIISYFIWVMQLRPRVKDAGGFLVVRNCYTETVIPWSCVAGAQWGRLGKMYLILEGRSELVELGAFSDWPSFGRREKVADELRELRARSVDAESVDIQVKKRFLGGAEILVLVYFFIAALCVVIQ